MLGVLEAGGYQLARINVPDLTHIPKIWKSPGCSFIYHILFVQVTLIVRQQNQTGLDPMFPGSAGLTA
jgi:hypothetical protein